MVEQSCIVRGCRSFVDSCDFTNNANSHTPKVRIHARQEVCHLDCYVAKARLF